MTVFRVESSATALNHTERLKSLSNIRRTPSPSTYFSVYRIAICTGRENSSSLAPSTLGCRERLGNIFTAMVENSSSSSILVLYIAPSSRSRPRYWLYGPPSPQLATYGGQCGMGILFSRNCGFGGKADHCSVKELPQSTYAKA